jgi:hypothetical protein
VVVCQIQPGNFYYRGVRLSDGASIELANAELAPDDWDPQQHERRFSGTDLPEHVGVIAGQARLRWLRTSVRVS